MSSATRKLPRADAESDPHTVRFEAMYEEHFGFVWRTLRRLGLPAAAAEDAAQDTFVIFHRKLGDVRPGAAKSFLFGIARRVASDHRRARRVDTESVDPSLVSGERDPFERTAELQAGRALERFLRSLDEDKRITFALSDLEGMNAREISELLGVNLNTVYSRLRAARTQFTLFLAREGKPNG